MSKRSGYRKPKSSASETLQSDDQVPIPDPSGFEALPSAEEMAQLDRMQRRQNKWSQDRNTESLTKKERRGLSTQAQQSLRRKVKAKNQQFAQAISPHINAMRQGSLAITNASPDRLISQCKYSFDALQVSANGLNYLQNILKQGREISNKSADNTINSFEQLDQSAKKALGLYAKNRLYAEARGLGRRIDPPIENINKTHCQLIYLLTDGNVSQDMRDKALVKLQKLEGIIVTYPTDSDKKRLRGDTKTVIRETDSLYREHVSQIEDRVTIKTKEEQRLDALRNKEKQRMAENNKSSGSEPKPLDISSPTPKKGFWSSFKSVVSEMFKSQAPSNVLSQSVKLVQKAGATVAPTQQNRSESKLEQMFKKMAAPLEPLLNSRPKSSSAIQSKAAEEKVVPAKAEPAPNKGFFSSLASRLKSALGITPTQTQETAKTQAVTVTQHPNVAANKTDNLGSITPNPSPKVQSVTTQHVR